MSVIGVRPAVQESKRNLHQLNHLGIGSMWKEITDDVEADDSNDGGHSPHGGDNEDGAQSDEGGCRVFGGSRRQGQRLQHVVRNVRYACNEFPGVLAEVSEVFGILGSKRGQAQVL